MKETRKMPEVSAGRCKRLLREEMGHGDVDSSVESEKKYSKESTTG